MVQFDNCKLFGLFVEEFPKQVRLYANGRDFVIVRNTPRFGREVFKLGFQLISLGLGIISIRSGAI